ncbi:MAG: non-canonical purine NTP pyrophosphatase, RdgB/HAM1 family [Acidobacteria bacterium]|nr:MAG: non-canonical purine NTP pyrophosphatase, RdgB/HAM1 family [Acidobacteriota bacterium]
MRAPAELFLASSNTGKLAEFRALASATPSAFSCPIKPVPDFASIPAFDENAPTFGENALGKALHYSRFSDGLVVADDSGLVVPVLGGAPGVHSARYAGPRASSEQRIAKLLSELQGTRGAERAAQFVCVIAAAERGRGIVIVSDRVDGIILESARGVGGFGYDPVFYFPHLNKTFAELSTEEKNRHSHRGRAFRRMLAALR